MLKRNVFSAIFALLLLTGVAAAALDYQYNVTDYATASDALTAYTNNWTSTYPTSGSPSLTVAQDGVSGNNALMFNNGATGSACYAICTYKNTIDYGDQFAFTMKFRIADETQPNGTNQLMLYFAKDYGNGTYADVWLMLRNNGVTANGSSGSWTPWYGSLAYTWHTITIDADFEAKTYDIYMDNGESPVLQMTMGAVNLPMKMGDGSGTLQGQVNVEYIQWGTVPEPASAMVLIAGALGGLLRRRRK